ncbi:MAG TPA: cytochrome-c peroxidase [Crocinitomix sp.]|nr:cytochrome-c peroxidase [Crocinitomix sp.]
MKALSILTVSFFFFLISCRKDEFTELPAGTTPYVLDLPENLAQYLPEMEIPADNPLTVEGVALGRKLFYEKKLSGDHTQSCADCHFPDKAFSDVVDFSIGIDGSIGTRNAMPVINVGWMNTLFWDGRSVSVEDQAFGPVVNPVEMKNTWAKAVSDLQSDPEYPALFKKAFGTDVIDSVLVVKAIAQFERTLISGNSPFDKYLRGEPTGWSEADILQAYQGYALFMDETKGDCFHCHGDQYNPLWTDNSFHNNGLDAVITDKGLGAVTNNPNDDGKFKTPTLRNLAYTAPYMHDGRFATLDEVLMHYSFGLQNSPTIDPLMKSVDAGGVQLSVTERNLIKKFLLSLSDDEFVTNPNFSAP